MIPATHRRRDAPAICSVIDFRLVIALWMSLIGQGTKPPHKADSGFEDGYVAHRFMLPKLPTLSPIANNATLQKSEGWRGVCCVAAAGRTNQRVMKSLCRIGNAVGTRPVVGRSFSYSLPMFTSLLLQWCPLGSGVCRCFCPLPSVAFPCYKEPVPLCKQIHLSFYSYPTPYD